jgi:hypothetical protein
VGTSGSLQRYCEAGEIRTRWSVPDRMSSLTMSCTAVLAIWLSICSPWFERPSARRKASRLRRRRHVPAVTCEATGSRSISSSALNMVPVTLHPAPSRRQTRRIGLRHTYTVLGSIGSTEQHPMVDGPGFGEPSGGSRSGSSRRAGCTRHGRRGARRPMRAVVTFDSCGVFVDRRTATKRRRFAPRAPARCRRWARRCSTVPRSWRSPTSAGRPAMSWLLAPQAAAVASASPSVHVHGVSTRENRLGSPGGSQ